MNADDVESFFAVLAGANPQPRSELAYSSVFELLAAVLLSALTLARYVREEGGDELAIKGSWLRQVFNASGDTAESLDIAVHFPKLKWVSWFNRDKESDWRISRGGSDARAMDPAVTELFLELMSQQKNGKSYFLDAAAVESLLP